MENDLGGDIPIKKKGFFEYVFNFDAESKSSFLNLIQYVVLMWVPISGLDALMRKIFPEAKDEKNTFELLGEIYGQTILTLILIVFIHRMVTYIPTYSGVPIGNINLRTITVGFLLSIFLVENQISKKMAILLTRLGETWEGKVSAKKQPNKQKKNSVVRVSQPISNIPQTMPTHQASRADYMHTHSQMAPPTLTQQVMPNQQQQPQQEAQSPTSQNIYGGPSNPLVDGQIPGGYQEPMAANAVLGGGGFSTW